MFASTALHILLTGQYVSAEQSVDDHISTSPGIWPMVDRHNTLCGVIRQKRRKEATNSMGKRRNEATNSTEKRLQTAWERGGMRLQTAQERGCKQRGKEEE